MTQSLSMRATSVGASAVLLGLAVFAAFSVTISFQTNRDDSPFSIPMITMRPDTPPPVERPRTPPPTRPLPQEPTGAALEPLTPIDIAGPPTTSFFPPVDIGPAQITNPRWLQTPRNLESYYPTRALAREIPGQVVLDCLVDVSGALNCAVLSETPANWGFGQAALRISRDYRMVPAMRDGLAVEGRYRMRVPFEVR